MVSLIMIYMWNFWFRSEQAMPLQKIIVAFPMFKTIHVAIITINIGICHETNWDTANKYFIMGLISIQTLTMTSLLTVLLLISKVTYYF